MDSRHMIEEQTIRLLDLLRPAISDLSPIFYLAALLGIVNCSVFYLFGFGRGFKLFIPYLVLAAAAAVGGAVVGTQLPETGPLIGDVSIAAASISTWTVLLIARSLRL